MSDFLVWIVVIFCSSWRLLFWLYNRHCWHLVVLIWNMKLSRDYLKSGLYINACPASLSQGCWQLKGNLLLTLEEIHIDTSLYWHGRSLYWRNDKKPETDLWNWSLEIFLDRVLVENYSRGLCRFPNFSTGSIRLLDHHQVGTLV